jgi:hypothetical protein
VRRKQLLAGVIAVTAATLVSTAAGAASSASAATAGIPSYLVSAIAIDRANHTAILPCTRGAPHLGRVWFTEKLQARSA